jgi:hypothetical protein
MTFIHEFNSPIWVQTPLGEGRAILMIDYGQDWNPIFLVHLNDGRFRCVDMLQIAGQDNLTLGIEKPPKPNKLTKTP